MSAVKECFTITQKLIVALKNPDDGVRENTIEHIEGLLNQREELLPEIRPPFSAEDQSVGSELVKLNKELSFLLEGFNKNILRELNALHLKKTSAARYTNPYMNVQSDGAFYDKRR